MKRLQTLLSDLDGIDASGSDQLIELRQGVSEVLRRISEIDQELAQCGAAPLDELIEAEQKQLTTPRQRRVAARGRLLAATLTLDGLPPSCTEAARLLKRAIKAELKKIEAARREEYGS